MPHRPSKKKAQDPRGPLLLQLGERVREARHAAQLTQEGLAEKLRLSVAYVSLIERGGRNPPYTTVVALARALGRSPGELVAA